MKKKTRVNKNKHPDLFSQPYALAKTLEKISEGKSDEAILKSKNSENQNLIHAIINAPQDLKLARYIPTLAKKGVDINHPDKYFAPPIFLAISKDHHAALNFLYEAGVDLQPINPDGVNILDWTLLNGNQQIYQRISVLLRLRSLILTPGNFLIELSEAGRLPEIKYLMQRACEWKLSVNVNAQHPFNKRTALMAAAIAKQGEVVKYLLENKADIYIQDYERLNVLAHGILNDNESVMNVLMIGADIKLLNQVNGVDELSPLRIAAEVSPRLVPLLLEKKADINAENKQGDTLLNTVICLKNPDLIDFIIGHPSLDGCQYTQPLRCLKMAIRHCGPAVLEKLLSLPGLDAHSLDEKQAEELYEFVLTWDKTAHFKVMVNSGLNQSGISIHHPLITCLRFEKTNLIEWFVKVRKKLLDKDSILRLLTTVIVLQDKRIASLFFKSILKREEYSEATYFLLCNDFARLCIQYNLFKLALKLEPRLTFFIDSAVFQGFSVIEFLDTIKYLQGNAGASQFSRWLRSEEIYLVESDPSAVLNRFPRLTNYIPDQKNPNKWTNLLRCDSPMTHFAVTPPIFESRIKILTPFAFFKEQGFSKDEIKAKLQKVQVHGRTERSFPIVEAKHKSKPPPCAWFGGLITSDHTYLHAIEGSTIQNSFLLIPDALFNTILVSRWHFHPDKGLKPLKKMPTVQVSLQFTASTIDFETPFTCEIASPDTEDRILCITVAPDKVEQRGILYLAVHYLPGGLHHRRTPLPDRVPVIMPVTPTGGSAMKMR